MYEWHERWQEELEVQLQLLAGGGGGGGGEKSEKHQPVPSPSLADHVMRLACSWMLSRGGEGRRSVVRGCEPASNQVVSSSSTCMRHGIMGQSQDSGNGGPILISCQTAQAPDRAGAHAWMMSMEVDMGRVRLMI